MLYIYFFFHQFTDSYLMVNDEQFSLVDSTDVTQALHIVRVCHTGLMNVRATSKADTIIRAGHFSMTH